MTKGTGQPRLSEVFFLFLLNNGLLSDIDMLPVCHFHSDILSLVLREERLCTFT